MRLLASIILISFLLLSPTIVFGKLPYNPPELPGSNASNNHPSLAWDPGTVDRILYQGQATTLNVSLTSTQDLRNLDLWVVPELSSFVKTYPSHIDRLLPDKTTYIQLVINVPRTTQPGSYKGTLHIRQGKKTLPQTLKFALEVKEPVTPPKEYAYITGYVYNSRTGSPISGAKVTAHGVDGGVYSDSTGKYVAALTYSGKFSLTIKKEGYTYSQRNVMSKTGLDTSVDPVYLTPLDSKVNVITSSGGIAKNSTGTIEVNFPSGAVSQTISFVITQCEKSRELPHPLPPLSFFTYASFFDSLENPEGITLNQPVEVKVANSLGFAPGTPIPVGAYNKDTVQWEAETMAYVTPDGNWVKFETSRFSTLDVNLSSNLGKPGIGPPMTAFLGVSARADAKASDPGIEIKTGILGVTHAIPSYRSLDASNTLVLTYNSTSANPTVSVNSETYLENYNQPDLIPKTSGFIVDVQGKRNEVKFSGSTGFIKQGYMFEGINIRGERLSTGSYPYHITLSNDYELNYATADYFGGPPVADTGVQSRELVSLSTEVPGRVTILNHQTSPFGAGWSLSGLQKLYFSPDGVIMLDEGDGGTTTYSPNGGFELGSLAGFVFEGAARKIGELGSIYPPEGQYMGFIETGGMAINDASTSLKTTGGILIPEGVLKLDFRFNFISEAWPELVGLNYNALLTVNLISPSGTQSSTIANFQSTSMKPVRGVDFGGGDSTAGSSGWITRSLDVTQYAGTGIPVILEFKIDDFGDRNYTSAALIDDIKFSSGGDLPIYIPDLGDFSGFAKKQNGTYMRISKFGGTSCFNDKGFLTSSVDNNGNTTSCTYDAEWRIIAITDSAGLTTSFAYSGNAIRTITDPIGRITRLSVDAGGDLVQIVNPDNTSRAFTYGADHLLTSEVDARGYATVYTYGDFGRIKKVTFPTGSEIKFYPGELEGIINTLPLGVGTPDNPAPAVPPPSDYVTDGRGFTTQYKTNEYGGIIESTDPLGRTISIERDTNNSPRTITEPNGTKIKIAYDMRGNPESSSVHLPGDPYPFKVSHFTYDHRFSKVRKHVDPKGNTSIINYDSNGNPVIFIDSQGNTSYKAYDSRGLLISTTNSIGVTAQYLHNSMGNFVSVTDSFGNTTSCTTDLAGNPVSLTDAEGRENLYNVDIMNRLLSVTDPFGNKSKYSYDPNGNLETLTDPMNNTKTYLHNGVNLPVTITNPLGHTMEINYDKNENISSVRHFDGTINSYVYDGANQIVKRITPDNIMNLVYDISGNLTSITDNDTSLSFSYHPLGGVISAITHPTISQPYTEIFYTFDKNGNCTSSEAAGIGRIEYGYDSLNRLVSIAGRGSPIGHFSYIYDSLGRRLSTHFPNETSSEYRYDQVNNLISLSNKKGTVDISSYSYTYNKSGYRTAVRDDSGETVYTYDDLNRLVAALYPMSPAELFAYDSLGNRVSSHISPNNIYDKGNRLLEDSAYTYSYDRNGNLIEKCSKLTGQIRRFTYDSDQQLIKVEMFPSRMPVPPSSVVTYRYDGLGRRVEKNVNGIVNKYIYDDEDVIMELDGSNNIIALYAHGLLVDEPLMMRSGGHNYYYHPDGLGSTRQITDEQGSVVQTYGYGAFGNILSAVGNIQQPFTFAAREFDEETRLYYLRSRYYDPDIGRFISEDPFDGTTFAPQTHNLFAYCANNPVNFTDPSGCFKMSRDQQKNKRYKKFAKFVQGISTATANDSQLRAAMIEYGGFDDATLDSALKWGNPPLIRIQETPDSGPAVFSEESNSINVNQGFVDSFNSLSQEGWALLGAEVLLLHETTHYGDYNNPSIQSEADIENYFNSKAYGLGSAFTSLDGSWSQGVLKEFWSRYKNKRPGYAKGIIN